jgi:ABC-type spermidine/putrescine transport system permease subunit I
MGPFLNKALVVVGVLLLAYGYAVWFTRHESNVWRAILSFIYLIPGWALTAMGYIGWRIERLGAARRDPAIRESF